MGLLYWARFKQTCLGLLGWKNVSYLQTGLPRLDYQPRSSKQPSSTCWYFFQTKLHDHRVLVCFVFIFCMEWWIWHGPRVLIFPFFAPEVGVAFMCPAAAAIRKITHGFVDQKVITQKSRFDGFWELFIPMTSSFSFQNETEPTVSGFDSHVSRYLAKSGHGLKAVPERRAMNGFVYFIVPWGWIS